MKEETVMNAFNEIYGTSIDKYGTLFSALAQKPDMVSDSDPFYMHVYDIPENRMSAGFIKEELGWIWYLCSMKDDGSIKQVLFSMLVKDPKRLRQIADHMIKSAEKMEA